MLVLLDTENADRNIAAQVAVLTHTPDEDFPIVCQAVVFLGDGTKNLDGTGGDFELTITVGEQTVEPDPQIITFSTATRVMVFTGHFPVPANSEVILKVKSPNAGDSDVDVTAYLYDVSDTLIQKGTREFIVDSGTTYARAYLKDGVTKIIDKALKDVDGNDIVAFDAGKIVKEERSTT